MNEQAARIAQFGWQPVYCLVCVGDRITAENKAVEAGVTELPEDWTAAARIDIGPKGDAGEWLKIDLPSVNLADSYAPQWTPHEVQVGLNQMQQMWAPSSVPVCRERHIGQRKAPRILIGANAIPKER